ncbi:hypothetical protein HBN50_02215 [Halobacteriovorax sp. GB3]|uniref:hypothetical protein n=1 Tax=Halobacteriovorax sp. GB3 TaxID=2719615 RepID=UPI00236147D3|nr:hypothetical protein [Halobacteriovorax sp. GB3]MDD0851887.1 hypothetical protein [Halobacteriovorax sp. GB3]
MLTCKRVYTLLWSSEDLHFWQKCRVSLHLLICPNCRRAQELKDRLDMAMKKVQIKYGDLEKIRKLEDEILVSVRNYDRR